MDDEIGNIDALIIPGTRNSISDMVALDKEGFTDKIQALAKEIPERTFVGLSDYGKEDNR